MNVKVCPFCGSDQTHVYDTRSHGNVVVRRRKCKICFEQWKSAEIDFDTYKKLLKANYEIEKISKEFSKC